MVNSLLRAQIGVELCHCQGCRAVRRVAYAGSTDVRGPSDVSVGRAVRHVHLTCRPVGTCRSDVSERGS